LQNSDRLNTPDEKINKGISFVSKPGMRAQ
jgi:hypothetical protein